MIIGIDGGGTKTDFVLCLENGIVKKRVIDGPGNINDIGFDAFKDVVRRGISALLEGAESREGIVLFAGLSGGTTGGNRERAKAFFESEYPYIKSECDCDIVNAISLGLGEKNGVAVIAGTGSIALAQKNKKLYRAGGWGYLFDRAGSGYDIGRDAVFAALSEHDRTSEETLLTKLLQNHIGRPVSDALADIYSKGKRFIASLAPLVFEGYRQNDKVAVNIINKTAAHLAQLIDVCSTYLDERDNDVVLIGGLFKEKEILLPLIKSNLRKNYNFIIPSLPPVYGAVLKACDYAGIKVNDDFRNNFEKTINGKGE